VDGGERNSGLQGETERDRIAVMDLLGDRLGQRAALVGQRWLQVGERFARKALIPSSASREGPTVAR
jgi:hypothetical protein